MKSQSTIYYVKATHPSLLNDPKGVVELTESIPTQQTAMNEISPIITSIKSTHESAPFKQCG